MTHLRTVRVTYRLSETGFQQLAALPTLEDVTVRFACGERVRILASSSTLRSLSYLGICNDDMRHVYALTKLQRLHIAGDLTDPALIYLQFLTNLTHLTLEGYFTSCWHCVPLRYSSSPSGPGHHSQQAARRKRSDGKRVVSSRSLFEPSRGFVLALSLADRARASKRESHSLFASLGSV